MPSVTAESRAFVVGCLVLGLAELHEQGVLYRGLSEPAKDWAKWTVDTLGSEATVGDLPPKCVGSAAF